MTAMITLQDAKEQLNIDVGTFDDEIEGYTDAVTSVVERYTGQTMDKDEFTDTVNFGYAGTSELALKHWPVSKADIVSITSLDGSTTWDLANVIVTHRSILHLTGGPGLRGWVNITYRAGYEVNVPPSYRLAALIIVQHLWETQRGTMGVSQAGGLDTSVNVYGMGFAIPNRALELLGKPVPRVA